MHRKSFKNFYDTTLTNLTEFQDSTGNISSLFNMYCNIQKKKHTSEYDVNQYSDRSCNCIIQEIQEKLFIFNICSSPYIKYNDNNRGIFCYTCFLYFNLEFNTQDQFLFLLNLVKKCFNTIFNLVEFQKNYDIILNKNLLLPS